MAAAFPPIPYGRSDFAAMRGERCLYVDKTRFLRDLEDERYAFLIRPLSLMHYFGLLSIREVRDGLPRLGIPNQTVKRLMYGYLRDAYERPIAVPALR